MHAHEAGAVHADVGNAGLGPAGGVQGPPGDLNELDPKVWPASFRRRADGVVELAGHDVRDLVAAHSSPVYLLDEDDFRARIREWRDAFAGADVYYAGKAFLSAAVVGWLAEEGVGLDVCTAGELAVAQRAGFPTERIIFHGNNKSTAELAAAVDAGLHRVVVDSHEEIVRLAALAAERGRVQDVLVRVTVGVEAHTHDYIATAHEDQKFGFSLAGGEAAEAVRRILKLPALRLVGLHSHIGSQIFDTSGFEVAAHRLVGLLAELRAEHDLELPELDLGGGLGIAYTSTDDPSAPADIAARLRRIVADECRDHGLAVPRLAVEPGRAIAGPPTVTVYEVGTVKAVEIGPGQHRAYVSVDGGMSDNIRTSLYGAAYTCSVVSRAGRGEPMLSRVVGKHCESGDVVVEHAWLPDDVVPGDLIAVAATGAYCRSMASNYNHVPRPPVVAVRAGAEPRTLLRRETVEDLLALDVG